ncbi:MAG: VOC family protein [Elstera sp.]
MTGLDHLIYGVANLDAAREQFRRLGFVVTPRGRHKGWGTANYCVMLSQGYIELLGIIDPSQFTNNLDTFLATRGEGLLAISLATDDAGALAASLTERGLHPDGPHALSRLLETDGEPVEPAFSLLRLPPEELPAINGFFAQHLTPELLRQPGWETHPNAVTGIASVTIAVDDPAAVAAAYEVIYGRAAVVATDDAWAVHLGDESVLLFVTPEEAASLYPSLADLPESPTIVATTLRSATLEQTQAALTANGVSFDVLPGNVVRVAPEAGCGAVLEFLGQA